MNDVAMAQAVQAAAKPKFRGHKVLKSKAAAYFPENVSREYMRVTNAYMALLNKTLAKHLPAIRMAIDADRDNVRHDDANEAQPVIAGAFMAVRSEFAKKAEAFGLGRKLAAISNMSRKLKIKEWKKAVHSTLGINILEDYYKGEFFRESMKTWVETNVNLIKTIPQDTLGKMRSAVQEGYAAGKSNTSIGKAIQEAYGIEKRHAQFIARDQVAKLNASLTQAQHKDAGVEEYVWSASRDQRVRDRHAELDGKRFKWSDPPIVDEASGRRCHPGEDYNCRCVALPVFNLPELSLPWEKGAENDIS